MPLDTPTVQKRIAFVACKFTLGLTNMEVEKDPWGLGRLFSSTDRVGHRLPASRSVAVASRVRGWPPSSVQDQVGTPRKAVGYPVYPP